MRYTGPERNSDPRAEQDTDIDELNPHHTHDTIPSPPPAHVAECRKVSDFLTSALRPRPLPTLPETPAAKR